MIFISYAHQDTEFANRLAWALKERGLNVWIASQDIPPGAVWTQAVGRALREAVHVVVILSPASISSRQVTFEAIYAQKEDKVVIPVLYQKCDPDFWLQPVQHVDFTTWSEGGLEKLASALQQKPPSGPATEAPARGWLEEFLRATVSLLFIWGAVGAIVWLSMTGLMKLNAGNNGAAGLLFLGALGLLVAGLVKAPALARYLLAKPKPRLPKAST